MVETIGVVPLRKNSKGLPGKNVRPLAGRPLFMHAVEQARAAGLDRCIVSTDIEELVANPPEGVEVIARPPELAEDTTPMDAVLGYLLSDCVSGAARIVLLQATSPLRQAEDIRAALALHDRGDHDLVLSVVPAEKSVLKWGMAEGETFIPLVTPEYCFSNREALPPVYRPNGAVYVFDADWYRKAGTLGGGTIGMIEMPAERSVDIDSLSDFEEVARRLTASHGGGRAQVK